jgi:CheY-like chemotaxis protein/PAS domain-containing protein/HPt (histidine-containing phosphotransfer) domain-containing protein
MSPLPPASTEESQRTVAATGLLVAAIACVASAGAVLLGLHPAIAAGVPAVGAVACGVLLWRAREPTGRAGRVGDSQRRLGYLAQNAQLLADGLNLGLACLDAADVYTFANRALVRWLGRQRGELIGQMLGQAGDGALRQAIAGGLARARDGEIVHLERPVALHDGEKALSLWLVPQRSQITGQVSGLGLLAIDCGVRQSCAAHVADCRQRMHELAAAASAWLREMGQDGRLGYLPLEASMPAIEPQASLVLPGGASNSVLATEVRAAEALSRLQTMLQRIPVGFAMLDRAGNIVLCNSRLGDLLGGDSQTFAPGVALRPVLEGLVRRGAFARAAGHEAGWLEDRFGGDLHWTGTSEEQMAGGAWLLIGGRVTSAGGSALVAIDISALKAAETELRQAHDDLGAALGPRDDLLAEAGAEAGDAAGRLLGDLTGTLGSGLVGEQRLYGRLSRAAIDALLDEVDEVLDLSKVSARPSLPVAVQFDPAALVQEIARFLCGREPYAATEIGVVAGATVPLTLVGDIARLRQALLDLSVRGLRHDASGMVMRLDWSPVDYATGYLRFETELYGAAADQRAVGPLNYARELLSSLGGHVGTRVTNDRRIFWCTAQFGVAPSSRTTATEAREVPRARVLLCLPDVAAQAVTQQLRLWRCERVDAVAPADLRQAIREAEAPYHLALVDRALAGANAGAALIDLAGAGTQLVLVQDEAAPDAEPPAVEQGAAVALTRRPVLPGDLWQWLRRADLPAPAPAEAEPGPPPPEAGQPLQILLAEDSPTNQLVTKAMLEGQPVAIDIAGDGRQALEAARHKAYDLILMDVAMPVLDGLSATEAIRGTTAYNATVPIIALTANTMFDDQERCLAAGMDGFLSKPITRQALLDALRQWCREVGATDVLAAGLLDTAAVAQLRHDTGADAFARLIASFAAEARSRQARLVAAAAGGDRTGVEHEAHSLKSTSGTYGAKRLAEVAAAIEQAAMASDLARVERDIANLPHLVEATLQALETVQQG